MTNYAKQVKGTIAKTVLPVLEGTDKQVAWAAGIRQKAASHLVNNAILQEQYVEESLTPGVKAKTMKRPVKNLIAALTSTEGIQKHFDDMRANNVHASRFESTVKSMNDALDRHARMTEILSNASAKFWIDNRDDQLQNNMFKAFTEYVVSGVKKF